MQRLLIFAMISSAVVLTDLVCFGGELSAAMLKIVQAQSRAIHSRIDALLAYIPD